MEQRWLHLIVKELRAVRSPRDVERFSQKVVFLAHRLRGDFLKGWPSPPVLQVEPTNGCNLSCSCCGGRRNSRPKGYIDLSLFAKVIDEAASLKIQMVHLYMHGEPLLHPKIVEMVRYVKMKNLPLTLISNGMLLDRGICSQLLASGMNNSDYIVVSVLGHSKRVHEQIMAGVEHERVVRNITDLLELRRQRNMRVPFVETAFYTLPENRGEEKAYLDYWSRWVDHARVSRASEQYASKAGRNPFKRTAPCRNLSERISVLWNGDVPLCHADIDAQHLLGNVGRESLMNIWNREKHLSVQQIHRSLDFERIPLCAHCDW